MILKIPLKYATAGGRSRINASGETVNTWKADHIYRHSENAIIAFLLLLFIAVNIFNIFHARNIKDRSIKTMVSLINKINAEFNTIKRPLPLIPIPI